MKWGKAGKYHLTSGDYTICKVTVQGVLWYEAWHLKDRIGMYRNLEDAKILCNPDCYRRLSLS